MKLCFLANANSSHTKKWCEYFVKHGYKVFVISLDYDQIEGVEVYTLNKSFHEEISIIKKAKCILYLLKIKKILKKIQPDIIHAHYATSYGLIGSLINWHPYILSAWGSDIFSFPNKSILHKYLIKFNLSKSDFIFSTSNIMALEIRKYTTKDVEITPFGVNIDRFLPKKDENFSKRFIIGTIKTLEKQYGIEYLIRGFALFRKKYAKEEIFLEIGGRGSLKDELQQLANELGIYNDVKFLGFLSENEIIKKFNEFNIAVFPSLHESFGVAVLEAQACNTPVIVTSVGGFLEVTKPNESSILVEPRNYIQIAQAIEMLYLDPRRCKLMGEKGRRYVVENFDINRNFKLVEVIYDKIANK